MLFEFERKLSRRRLNRLLLLPLALLATDNTSIYISFTEKYNPRKDIKSKLRAFIDLFQTHFLNVKEFLFIETVKGSVVILIRSQ